MLFGEAALSVSFGKGENSNQAFKTDKSSGWGAGLGITPGISFQVGKKLSLEASLGNLLGINYTTQKTEILDPTGTVTSSSTRKDFSGAANVNGFNSINIGIRWIIPKS